MKRYFRAMKVQKKYLRNRLKFGPDMETRSTKLARGCLNFIGLSMHGLMEVEARPKIADFLRDRLVKLQLKENFGIFYRKSNYYTFLTLFYSLENSEGKPGSDALEGCPHEHSR